MAITPKDELAAFEKDLLPAWEAATILLDSHGTRASERALDRLDIATKAGNEVAKLFWNKVLSVLISISKAEQDRPGHDSKKDD